MKIYFDTSVLVSVLVRAEPYHTASVREYGSHFEKVTSTHALGELFSTLTSGRLPVQFTPQQAAESLRENIIGAFELYSFTPEDYQAAAA